MSTINFKTQSDPVIVMCLLVRIKEGKGCNKKEALILIDLVDTVYRFRG